MPIVDTMTPVMVTCYRCKTPFSMPRYLYDARLIDHHNFWCPLGHDQFFIEGKTDAQLLREERERTANLAAALDFQKQQREAAEAETARLKKSAARAKKRVANGVCPCCHRTVKQMAQHMKAKHPGYVTEATK